MVQKPPPGGSAIFFVKGEKIILKRDGSFFSDGVEITHDETRETFYRSIGWDAERREYYLQVGYERLYIEVEDTAYFVTSVEGGAKGFVAKLSNGAHAPIGATNLSYEEEKTGKGTRDAGPRSAGGSLYLTLLNGLRARFLSPAYYEILKNLREDSAGYYLDLAGIRIELLPK